MRVGVLLFDDVEELDFVGPLEVFGAAGLVTGKVEAVTLSRDGGEVRCRYGLRVKPEFQFGNCPTLDLLVIPGGKGSRKAMRDEETLSFLRNASPNAHLMSVCTGALILAEAGLLDGHQATTHHTAIDSLKQHPLIRVSAGARYTHEENVSTSAGISAGIDLALEMVRHYFGDDTQNQVAEIMEYEIKQVAG
jgi:transcriptional regulator GlxA family with amidase domain